MSEKQRDSTARVDIDAALAKDQTVYVMDTNILVDYVDIIPEAGWSEHKLENPTVDLSRAHIVVPTAVVRELSSFKKERSWRGRSAVTLLRRLRDIDEEFVNTMDDNYHLKAPVQLNAEGQLLSTLPIHKNFKKCLPFSPSERDMDGQIILAALTVMFLRRGWPIDGSFGDRKAIGDLLDPNVVLLTNDNGLAKRAHERGVRTSRYGYEQPEPYTGRRDIAVAKEVFYEFYNTQRVELDFWREYMPDQPDLVANEFIIMSLADEADYPREFEQNDPYFCYIGKYDAEEEAIVRLEYATRFPIPPRNPGQAIYAEALMDPNINAVICTGPAGSGKTYMATIYGYEACKRGAYIGVTVVPCDPHSNLGALPGDLDEKMDPDVRPLKNALRNYVLDNDPKFRKEMGNIGKSKGACSKTKDGNGDKHANEDGPGGRSIKERLNERVDLIWDKNFTSMPIDYARGLDFSYELAIYDEFQDQNNRQADTLIKRIGTAGKIVITGDIEQIHAPYIDAFNNGLVYASRQLLDTPMVAQVSFLESEVIRHPLVRMIAMRQKSEKHKKDE